MPTPATKAIPDGMHSITPHLVCAGAAEAIRFYVKAFGAVEKMIVPGPEGKLMHACVQIGDSQLFLMDEFVEWGAVGPKGLKSSPVTIHLQVEDADAAFAKALAAGCTVTMPLEDAFWGDRYGSVTDPFGHSWAIATHKLDMSPEEIQAAMARMG
ncbi:MAG: VOC family protein [Ramlibacter sp.]